MERGDFNNLDDFNLPNRVWGTENNGVSSENVSLENGIVDIKIDETNKIGGALESKSYYSYGSFEMVAKADGISGICYSLWTFFYEDNGNVNHEIDIEFFGKNNENNNVIYSSYIAEDESTHIEDKLDYDINDNNYHSYRFDWFEDKIDYYIDGIKKATIVTNVPYKKMKVWLGAWCPSWAGENLEGIYHLYIKSFTYKAF